MVTKLDTIQKKDKLNEVCRIGEAGPDGAYHDYAIVNKDTHEILAAIEFQKGPRKDPEARQGALDCDLLEIVRDRLKAFQRGPYECRENKCAIIAVESALFWLNERVKNRSERNVLGTMEK